MIRHPPAHTDEVGVAVVLVVDDGEDLGLHAYVEPGVGERKIAAIAEDAVLEGRLVLVDGAAGASSRVGPVDLVGLANVHVLAVLPVVFGRELDIVGVVLLATEALAPCCPAGLGARTGLVVLAGGAMLSAKVPVHIDGAEAGLPVRGQHGLGFGLFGSDEG